MSAIVNVIPGFDLTSTSFNSNVFYYGDTLAYSCAKKNGTWWLLEIDLATMEKVKSVDTGVSSTDYTPARPARNATSIWVPLIKDDLLNITLFACPAAMTAGATWSRDAATEYDSINILNITASDSYCYVLCEEAVSGVWDYTIRQFDGDPAELDTYQEASDGQHWGVVIVAAPNDNLYYVYHSHVDLAYHTQLIQSMAEVADQVTVTGTVDSVYADNSYFYNAARQYDGATCAYIASVPLASFHSWEIRNALSGSNIYVQYDQIAPDRWKIVEAQTSDMTIVQTFSVAFPDYVFHCDGTHAWFKVGSGNPSGYWGGIARYDVDTGEIEYYCVLGAVPVVHSFPWVGRFQLCHKKV